MTDRMERVPGVAGLASFIRHLRLNLPRSTTAGGLLLLCGLAACWVYLLVAATSRWIPPGASAPVTMPTYVQAYLALAAACAVAAAVAIAHGRSRPLTRTGWWLGSALSAVALAGYLVSRTVGLPGAPQWVGRWDFPLGTFIMLLAGVFLVTHAAVLASVTVASPDRRDWHD